jgi:hypothetical protein
MLRTLRLRQFSFIFHHPQVACRTVSASSLLRLQGLHASKANGQLYFSPPEIAAISLEKLTYSDVA